MRALSSADCLNLWERGTRLHPLDQALLALGAALPETPYEVLADWPLGRRNSALAELRCACFGRTLQGQISCPRCAEELEFQMDAQGLMKAAADSTPTVGVKNHSFRLPTTRDLARIARETDPRRAAIQLVESCRTDAVDSAGWPDEELEEIGERMAAADPMAEIRMTFDCDECGYQWQENLDIVAFFWTEIEARAKRLLMEVHTLAAAYGWTEKETLALSEPRRARYLEMVRT